MSKYDLYWTGKLADIRAAVACAASGQPAVVGVPGLTSMGDRQSWHGLAEVRGDDVTHSSMAHARSLGRRVAASGLCLPWPESTFRFTIATGGDTLTISMAGGRQAVRPATLAGPRQEQAQLRSTAALGQARAESNDADTSDAAVVAKFNGALSELAEIVHGPRRLRDARGSDGWPRQGVYFFYETGELRADGSDRVVRVGTHALTATSRATLWSRLRQHRGHIGGSHPGGGNHRASVFRRHVGAALIRREKLGPELLASWLDRHGPRLGFAATEAEIEQAVSRHIGAMPFLWLSVPDAADRGYIERNSIALTSRLAQGPDLPSASWLGRHADRSEISGSGLWNVNHVHDRCDPGFLDQFEHLVTRQQ
jgi:hypothetical protein